MMAIESDIDLMSRVSRGDAESFDELLRRYRTPLVKYFCRLVRDQALAEDLAQEVFLRVYKARDRYRPDARFTANGGVGHAAIVHHDGDPGGSAR